MRHGGRCWISQKRPPQTRKLNRDRTKRCTRVADGLQIEVKSLAATLVVTHKYLAPGPKVSQHSAMVCMICKPSHTVCADRVVQRILAIQCSHRSQAIKRVSSISLGGLRWWSEFLSRSATPLSTLPRCIATRNWLQPCARLTRQTYKTSPGYDQVQTTTQEGKRSICSKRRDSIWQPLFSTLKNSSIIQRCR